MQRQAPFMPDLYHTRLAWRVIHSGLWILLARVALLALPVMAQQYLPPYPVQEKPDYVDIILTDGRICHKCHWTYEDWGHVTLENRRGLSETVSPDEIIGIDRHPLLNKIYLHVLPASELAGEVISPEAVMDMSEAQKQKLKMHYTPTMPAAPVNKPAE